MMIKPSLPERYKSLNTSESGGFSNVQLCKDSHLDRIVAIKTIKNSSEISRIHDEVNALMRLRSKHVVQVFDLIYYEQNDIAIVMEYINGIDLFRLDMTRCSPEKFIKLLWQLSSGIRDIHSEGIIHRDLKPNNMKVDDEGVLKIFDFGLSRNNENAHTVGFKGTLGFAAPEQYTNGHLHFSGAVDVYAFGAIALYMLTNTLPKELQSIPPTSINRDAFDNGLLDDYPELKQCLLSCLASDPSERPEISQINKKLSKFLLYNEHKALAVTGHNSHVIDKNKQKVRVNSDNIGSFEIHYNGFDFLLVNPKGEVYLNNFKVHDVTPLPGSCVVALGSSQRRHQERSYVTFDISNPEVSL